LRITDGSRQPLDVSSTTDAPRASGIRQLVSTPVTWNIGTPQTRTSSGCTSICIALTHAIDTSLPCVCSASLGVPVVPPVWNIEAVSCGENTRLLSSASSSKRSTLASRSKIPSSLALPPPALIQCFTSGSSRRTSMALFQASISGSGP
jgi:hypothetical protein